jgi:hypothetical protein
LRIIDSVIQRRSKVSAAVALPALALPCLLVCGPMAAPSPELRVEFVAAVEDQQPRASCRMAGSELRFGWIQAGEEPHLHRGRSASVCLAVYHVDSER